MSENVLGKDIEQERFEVRRPYVPIGEALNLRTEEITIVEPKGVDVAVHPEFIFVAGAIEEYAP
ncbi:MAG TPA: hypothetical protein VHM25_04055, partial [Polyangiaceae bacterium]|nr:hypothetical protein [Polyangiaceae bacterium]